MATILPTHSCFDDALEYLWVASKARPEWAAEHLRLVHAICLAPEGPRAGEPFAHAWVEEDRQTVIQAGIVDGTKGYWGCERREYYKMLRVQMVTVYTVDEAVERNYRTNHFGPWEQVYRDLCSTPGSREVFHDDGSHHTGHVVGDVAGAASSDAAGHERPASTGSCIDVTGRRAARADGGS